MYYVNVPPILFIINFKGKETFAHDRLRLHSCNKLMILKYIFNTKIKQHL